MRKKVIELADLSIHAWIEKHQIKNEKGDRIEFLNHLCLYDIYADQSDKLVVMKAAQVGLSTLEILKNAYDAYRYKMDIIYTLPTDGDVSVFVGGKVNRIIANNDILLDYTADKDSIEQKAIGQSMLYFRGTWTKKSAIMVTADRLVHDEKDSSKQEVIRDYQSRLQHSRFKQTHIFSHPSVPNNGVDIEWQLSDQKEWLIRCPHCRYEQFLSWNTDDPSEMSVDFKLQEFVCKKCGGILAAKDRAVGRWVAQRPGQLWSGYHISLLMAPWITAKEIIEKWNDPKQSTDYFYNKVLGLPYAGSGNAVTRDLVMGAITKERNTYNDRLVMGVDTGKALHYVVGNRAGLVAYGIMKSYSPDERLGIRLEDSLEYYLQKFPDLVMVIDQGGDIIGSRQLRAKYPGRVFLCHYAADRKTYQLLRWGEGDESGNVIADRNRMIQLVIDELRERRFRLYNGTEAEWNDYWTHWSHIYRTKEENELGVEEYKWQRSDRDDFVHATVYWRIGITKFGQRGSIILPTPDITGPRGYILNANTTVSFNPDQMFGVDPYDASASVEEVLKNPNEEPWWAKPRGSEDEWR